MSTKLHLTSRHTTGTSRMHPADDTDVGLADVGTPSDPSTRVVLMRRAPTDRSQRTHLHGLFATPLTLIVFWTTLPLPPTSFSVDVRTYHLNLTDVEACLDADVWGHEILGYVPVPADATAMLPSQYRFDAERLVRPEAVHSLLTDLCDPSSGIPDLTIPARTPVIPSGRVLLTRWNAFPELREVVGRGTTLRIQDSGQIVYSAPAARIQEAVLAGVPLMIRASNLAEDLDDSDDVLQAASRMYSPTSDSPYRWFQIAMNDANRLGTKSAPPFSPRRI